SRLYLNDPFQEGLCRASTRLQRLIEQSTADLRAALHALAPSEVVTFGEGLGGHSALVFGALLHAARIIAIEPPSHLIARELALSHDRRWDRLLTRLPDPAIARSYDVPALFERVGYQGRALVLFGTRRTNDHHDAVNLNVIHAHRLALSPRVTLCPFPEFG